MSGIPQNSSVEWNHTWLNPAFMFLFPVTPMFGTSLGNHMVELKRPWMKNAFAAQNPTAKPFGSSIGVPKCPKRSFFFQHVFQFFFLVRLPPFSRHVRSRDTRPLRSKMTSWAARNARCWRSRWRFSWRTGHFFEGVMGYVLRNWFTHDLKGTSTVCWSLFTWVSVLNGNLELTAGGKP